MRVLPVIGLGLPAVAAVALTVRCVPIRNRMVLGTLAAAVTAATAEAQSVESGDVGLSRSARSRH
jgi:hypothetical protein